MDLMLFTETTQHNVAFSSLCFAVRRTLGSYVPVKDSFWKLQILLYEHAFLVIDQRAEV